MSYKLINGDCREILKQIGDESIDLVVTDCPYKIVSGGCTTVPRKDEPSGIFNRRSTFTQETAKSGKLFDCNDIEFEEWLPEVYRVLKQDTHCYIMINSRNLSKLQQVSESVGFKFQNLLVWDKGNVTPNRYYMQGCEYILMLRKGRARNINNMGTSNILRVPNIIGKKLHPTEKPVDLMKILIENSSNEGDLVLDPFMGVGGTGVSAIECGRDFIGIEIDKKYYNISKDRIIKHNIEVQDISV